MQSWHFKLMAFVFSLLFAFGFCALVYYCYTGFLGIKTACIAAIGVCACWELANYCVGRSRVLTNQSRAVKW